MNDDVCVQFLQWVLPQLHMRWPGFRKVRKQVCKRLQRRISELDLTDIDAYRNYLQVHANEWPVLDHLCRVTVSRFYRDKVVLEHVRTDVLPELAQAAIVADDTALRGWSAGCAMGEEAYSLVLIWDKTMGADFSRLVDIQVIGSDIDEELLQRARRACYSYGSIKALPDTWLMTAFTQEHDEYCLEARLRSKVIFIKQDIRDRLDTGPFHIVFCRNMAFTYFENALQLKILEHIRSNLVNGGALVIGGHESLPDGYCGFEQWSTQRAVFRKVTRDEEKR
jgi:chemotaxis protein methyltransferase CheR